MELVDFLRARLDEDEAIAREAAAQYGSVWTVDDGMESVHSDTGADVLAEPDTPRAHIARHDPARVFAEVEAKRATIADYEKALRKRDGLEPNTAGYRHWDNRAFGLYLALRHAVAVYADYPGYAEALAAEEAALLADE